MIAIGKCCEARKKSILYCTEIIDPLMNHKERSEYKNKKKRNFKTPHTVLQSFSFCNSLRDEYIFILSFFFYSIFVRRLFANCFLHYFPQCVSRFSIQTVFTNGNTIAQTSSLCIVQSSVSLEANQSFDTSMFFHP